MNKFINKCIDIRLSIILIPVISSLILIGASPIKFNKSRSKIARQYIEGEILIKFKKKIPQQNQINTIRRYGCETLKTITKNSISHVKLERGTSVEDAIDIFNNDPSVEYAQPNYIYTISAVPNDTEYGELWGLKNTGQTVSSAPYATNNPGTSGADMNLEPAWDVITDCSSIVVAVIDTGVDYNHEDLAGNMWDDGSGHSGYDFIHNDNDPMDLNGHGTHCAGSIGAIGDNSTGTTGICWQAKIMAVRVLNAMGWGTTVNIIDGIIYAVDNGAKILSMSLGGPVYDHAYSDAITYSLDHDVIVVAAAGNGGDDGIGDDNDITPQYPSSFSQENVIAVAALDQAYELADFSNFGSTSVDVGAPGTNIWSAYDIELIDWDVITNDYSSGWTLTGDWNIWDYSGDGSLYLLRNPSDWYFSNYANNADDSAYQSFDLSGWDGAFFTSGICFDLQDGYDFLNIYASPSSGNPCLDVNNLVDYWTGTTPGYNDPPGYYTFYPFDFDVSSCATSTGTVGINLTSNDSVTAGGIALWNYSFSRIHLADNLYACWNGTSMATPHVSGLAAMIWAYNPDYTYADVINSVKNGGDDVSALSGNTTTGKAVDAWGSLCYINQPTGVTATLE